MEKMSTDDIIKKQQEILGKLSPEERKMALDILGEYSKIGESEVLKELLDSDYAETPADISTFLHDKKYLGNALYDQEGRFTLFPYWEEKLKEVFPDRFTTAYNTIVLTGAIGLGKSTVAVICLLYMLHRLLCLKDPYLYYGLQPIDKISISLMNITLENAKGVALDKMNQMILSSEWFMAHGQMSGVSNLMFVPDKHIELITASSNNQVIGRAIFCLDGETVIKTSEGDRKISDLDGKSIRAFSVDDCGKLVLSDECTVRKTLSTTKHYEVELEDGTVIKCTYGHRFMLKDGSYKEVQDLTEDDELLDVSDYDVYIQDIINKRGQWGIPMNEYHEGHHIIPRCLGGKGKTHSTDENIIWLYPEEHFIAHKLLCEKYPNNRKLKFAFCRMIFGPCGRMLSAEDYAHYRNMYAEMMSSRDVSDKTRALMSDKQRKRYETSDGTLLNKRAINNGDVCKYIQKDSELPEGFVYGNLTSGKHPKHTVHKKHVIKDPEAFKRQKSDQMSGEKNNMYGKGYKISGGKNGRAVRDYWFEDKYFDCRKSLLDYLVENVDKTLKMSSIRIYERGNGDKLIKMHPCLSKISWRNKDANKKDN